MAQHVVLGDSAPVDAPRAVGTHYIDRANRAVYLSVGTDTVFDWLLVTTSQVENNKWKKIQVEVTEDVLANNFFDLPDVAVEGTVSLHFGQLIWSEHFAYSLSTVNNKTRVELINELRAPSGRSAIELGEFIFVSYKSA